MSKASDLALRFPRLYRLFLKTRVRFMDDAWVKTRLTMQGHSLDKTLGDPAANRIYQWELLLLLQEIVRRGIPVDGTVQWVWDLLHDAQFGSVGSELSENSPAEMQDIDNVIRERRSIRKWDAGRPVDIAEIISLIDVAKWAPSSCNGQTWRFAVLTSPEDIAFCQGFARQAFYLTAPVLVVVYIYPERYEKRTGHYIGLDAGAVIQNLLLSCHAHGLGACWIGIPDTPERDALAPESWARFGVEAGLLPVSMVAIGYPAHSQRPPARRDTSELVSVPGAGPAC